MSIESRNSAAYLKRAEQLKRWEESDTNREPIQPKNSNSKIKFSSGCIFLAACVAGDKDEVKLLLNQGADINTANIDGLTALHQVRVYAIFPIRIFILLTLGSRRHGTARSAPYRTAAG